MDTSELQDLISRGLQDFYRRRLEAVSGLKLDKVLLRKNPYLFKALATEKASEIVEQILTAYISSSDETIFGDAFFELIARVVSGGKASTQEGNDIIIEQNKKVIAIALKSGPNPYNASAKRRQSQEFLAIQKRLYKLQKQFDPVLGHAYGRLKSEPHGTQVYRDLSGQAFWTEITGDPDFYLKLVRLMRDEPAKHRNTYRPEWDATVNRLTLEFTQNFCFSDGHIDWEKLVSFVSEDISVREAKKKYLIAQRGGTT